MVEASGLKQWVDFPTYKLGNILDLIIAELAAQVQIKTFTVDLTYWTTASSPACLTFPKQRLI